MKKRYVIAGILFLLLSVCMVPAESLPSINVSPTECYSSREELIGVLEKASGFSIDPDTEFYLDNRRLLVAEPQLTALINTPSMLKSEGFFMHWFVDSNQPFRLLTVFTPDGEPVNMFVEYTYFPTRRSTAKIEDIVSSIPASGWSEAVAVFLKEVRSSGYRYHAEFTWLSGMQFGSAEREDRLPEDQVLVLWGLWKLAERTGEKGLASLYQDQLLAFTQPGWLTFSALSSGVTIKATVLPFLDPRNRRPGESRLTAIPSKEVVRIAAAPQFTIVRDTTFDRLNWQRFEFAVDQLLLFAKPEETSVIIKNSAEAASRAGEEAMAEKYIALLKQYPEAFAAFTYEQGMRFFELIRFSGLDAAAAERITEELSGSYSAAHGSF